MEGIDVDSRIYKSLYKKDKLFNLWSSIAITFEFPKVFGDQ